MIQGGSGNQDFNAQMRKQRSSLVETTVSGVKTVIGCAGTINETRAGAERLLLRLRRRHQQDNDDARL